MRTVIETITNTYHDSYRNLIRDPAAFAVALAGARNRLGHGRGLNSGAQDAFNLVRVAEYVVAAVLAGQLGFEQSEVSESFGRSYRFNSLCRTFQTGDGGHSGPADEEPDAAD